MNRFLYILLFLLLNLIATPSMLIRVVQRYSLGTSSLLFNIKTVALPVTAALVGSTTVSRSLSFARVDSSFPTPPSTSPITNRRPVVRTMETVAPIEEIGDVGVSSDVEIPLELTEDERYLFDLNGYLIVRGVLSPEEVQEANDAIDRHMPKIVERSDKTLRNAVENTAFYGSGPPRLDLGGVLEWGKVDSRVFKSLLAHPKLVPRLHGIVGKGYRMDHLPFCILNDKGGEGFQLHGGTVDCTSGEYNHHLAYTCHAATGTVRSALLGCNVMLVDHNPGDGGFCVVPGSHKSNFKMPSGMVDGERYAEYIVQPATKAGDVVLFSEGTVHGAMSWKADHQRRTCLFRFAPATNAYGRSYFNSHDDHGSTRWPAAMYDDLTDAQRAVLEPPYANRLDRPNIESDGSITITTRSGRKKQHDNEVFGTKYF